MKDVLDRPVGFDTIAEWLRGSVSEKFAVVDAVVMPFDRSVVVKWIDEDEFEDYEDAVADSKDPAAAKRAYMFEPTPKFIRIWLNDGEDGEIRPVCHELDRKELAALQRELSQARFRKSGPNA